ncbi:MAG: DUF2520 domain-containing protein [Bacteroidota bacterium]|nr:DUF2520 domain-containing protein [Bacteroidota bacterium]MDX5447062.1 DUF2520 domain-containing protein [Bacteroidota bacterium]
MEGIRTISVIGAGRVAQHLVPALFRAGMTIRAIGVRDPEKPSAIRLSEMVEAPLVAPQAIPDADLILLLVVDGSIESVSHQLREYEGIIAHVSGGMPLSILADKDPKRGVFYPLQTFSEGVGVNWKSIPIFIEGSDPDTQMKLHQLAQRLSTRVYDANSDQRKALHVAAVFANNFVNQLYVEAWTICRENDIPFEALQALIQQTADKIRDLDPLEAQTGPAVRGDKGLIAEHLQWLKDPQQKKIYTLLSERIQAIHEKEL